MRYFFWLLKAAVFFVLFAFAVGNRDAAVLHVWPGISLQVPMMMIVLASFAIGCLLGIVVMLPRWWRYKRVANQVQQQARQEACSAQQVVTVSAELERHMIDPALPVTHEP